MYLYKEHSRPVLERYHVRILVELLTMLTEGFMVFVIFPGEQWRQYLKIGYDHLLLYLYLLTIHDDISILFNDVLFLHLIMPLNV
jgi:hypothetical protein